MRAPRRFQIRRPPSAWLATTPGIAGPHISTSGLVADSSDAWASRDARGEARAIRAELAPPDRRQARVAPYSGARACPFGEGRISHLSTASPNPCRPLEVPAEAVASSTRANVDVSFSQPYRLACACSAAHPGQPHVVEADRAQLRWLLIRLGVDYPSLDNAASSARAVAAAASACSRWARASCSAAVRRSASRDRCSSMARSSASWRSASRRLV